MTKKMRNTDHVRRKNVPGPDNEGVKAQLARLFMPAVYSLSKTVPFCGLCKKGLYRVYVDLACDSAYIIKVANCFSDVSYAVSHDGNLLASFDVYEPFVKLWN